ncbi:acyl-CoA N-acyltransferase [Roridomyces roridus]|uniref:Acyl-CoA N-acyltransferase n=1 Tax=Roridomyces roridus TaxID=1738132 RepID=A0AAD7BK48_9AGAR|nr:acyl-CoA N-acyltransferase [Roridomyces roridus]
MSLTARSFSDSDFEFMFDAFNSAVVWLTSKGLEDQWGGEPWDDKVKEKLRNKIPIDKARGARKWIAEVDGQPAGYLEVTPYRPDYLPVSPEEKPGKEFFLKMLVVHRKFIGRGVGEFLLDFAKNLAIEEKADWFRLDCYRGPEGKDGLVRYYEGKGFQKVREFANAPEGDEKKEWPGQLLEMKVSE